MTDIKKLLDEARDKGAEAYYKKYHLLDDYEGWESDEFKAGFDANKEIIVELAEALKKECYCSGEEWDCELCEALAKVEARLRGIR